MPSSSRVSTKMGFPAWLVEVEGLLGYVPHMLTYKGSCRVQDFGGYGSRIRVPVPINSRHCPEDIKAGGKKARSRTLC